MATPKTQGFALAALPRAPQIPGNVGEVDVAAIYDATKRGLEAFEAVRRLPQSMALADATMAAQTARQPLETRQLLAQTEGIEQQTPLNTAILASKADPAVLEAQRKVAITEASDPFLQARLAHLLMQATPAAVREIEIMTRGMNPDDKQKAFRVALGLEPRPSGAAIQYKEVVGADGVTRLVAVDPRAVGAQVVGTGQTYGTGVARPGDVPVQPISPSGGIQTPTSTANGVISPPAAQGMAIPQPAPSIVGTPTSPFLSQTPAQAATERVTATKSAEQIQEARAKLPQARISLEGLESATKRVEEDIDKAIGLVGPMTAGAVGGVMKALPIIGDQTDAGQLEGLINTIAANIGFDTLLQMRLSSPTGGALGNVSDYEGKQLQAAVADLKQTRDPAVVRERLQRVKQIRQEALRRVRDQYAREVQDYGFPVGSPATLGDQARPAFVPISTTPASTAPKFRIIEVKETPAP